MSASAARAVPFRRTAFYVLGAALAATFLFPLLWSALAALKTSEEANASPPNLWPSRLSLENFLALWRYGDGLAHYFGNSLQVAGMAGYGFSRFHFPLKSTLFMTVLITLMVPFQSILTPLFLVLRALGLQNSLLGLALVNVTLQLPFSVFMMRNCFDAIPRELDDAAAIDGCNSLGLLLRVLLPVAVPGVVTVALFAFLASWNEFLAALIFLTDADRFTLPIMLLNAQSGDLGRVDWGLMQAGITVTLLPCALLFLLFQRHYVGGLTAGAVK